MHMANNEECDIQNIKMKAGQAKMANQCDLTEKIQDLQQ